MRVKILCPNNGCGASYSVEDRRLGREARCKRCGRRFALVPETQVDGSTTLPFANGHPPTEPQGSNGLPPRFDRYRVIRRIGRGGMGTVYLAEDAQLERQVALKVPHIAPDGGPEVRERFLREARAAARFRHPNFCPIHDIGEVDGVPYLTMAFLEGRTLASMIDPARPWPQRRAAEFARQLAIALAEAHRQGIVHRDLKPANVMVEDRGGLVLMDFGLARRFDAADPAYTANGVILGTPAYMPPEQAEGNQQAIGPRSDIYSLGVILYELLTSRRPFEGSTARVLGQIACNDPPPPSTFQSEIDPRLESICLKAIARRPGDRYPSMDEFARAIDAWLQSDAQSPGGPDELDHGLRPARSPEAQDLARSATPELPPLDPRLGVQADAGHRRLGDAPGVEPPGLAREAYPSGADSVRDRGRPNSARSSVPRSRKPAPPSPITVAEVDPPTATRVPPGRMIPGPVQIALTTSPPEITNSIGMKLELIPPVSSSWGCARGSDDTGRPRGNLPQVVVPGAPRSTPWAPARSR